MSPSDLSLRLISKLSSSSLHRTSNSSTQSTITTARRLSGIRDSNHLTTCDDLIKRRRALDPLGHELDSIREEGFTFRPSDTLLEDTSSGSFYDAGEDDEEDFSPKEDTLPVIPSTSNDRSQITASGDNILAQSSSMEPSQTMESPEASPTSPEYESNERRPSTHTLPPVTAASALHSHPVVPGMGQFSMVSWQINKAPPPFLALRHTNRSPPPAAENSMPPSPTPQTSHMQSPVSPRHPQTSPTDTSPRASANDSRKSSQSSTEYGPPGSTIARKGTPTQLPASDPTTPATPNTPALTPASARSSRSHVLTTPTTPLTRDELRQSLNNISVEDFSALRESAAAAQRKRSRTVVSYTSSEADLTKPMEPVEYPSPQRRENITRGMLARIRTGRRRPGQTTEDSAIATELARNRRPVQHPSVPLLRDPFTRPATLNTTSDVPRRPLRTASIFDAPEDGAPSLPQVSLGYVSLQTAIRDRLAEESTQPQSPLQERASSTTRPSTAPSSRASTPVTPETRADVGHLEWWRQGPPVSRSAARSSSKLETITGGSTPLSSPTLDFTDVREAVLVTMERIEPGRVREVYVT